MVAPIWQLWQACPTYCYRESHGPQERPGYADAVAVADSAEIGTRGAPVRFFDSPLSNGIPLQARDFSQS